MKRIFLILLTGWMLASCGSHQKIDRKAVVSRHNITVNALDSISPAQVGNGEFAFGFDATGLQTFVAFNTLSHWGWHSFPLPEGWKEEDYKPVLLKAFDREVPYEIPNKEQPEISHWLVTNPHRFNLGRIGMTLLLGNGQTAKEKDITHIVQHTDLWTGIVTSHFELEGVPVDVKTACHPESDKIAVAIESELVEQKRLSVFFDFPYHKGGFIQAQIGDYTRPDKHETKILEKREHSAVLSRKMDGSRYHVAIGWENPARFAVEKAPHRFSLQSEKGRKIAFTCQFSQEREPIRQEDVFAASRKGWKEFWESGAAIDLSGSTDSRWKELERRVVLSQYQMRLNEAGSLPPQESGLVNNGWYGRFHFEMIWWHGVHYALWNRWELFDRYLDIYQKYLPTSRARAARQGYKGARWPKCTGNFDREWPNIIHATLIWQQPHPIYFAELDYRLHPERRTLEKWKDVVFETADFMASLPHYEAENDRYVLGPPLFIVSENTGAMNALNPAFEVGYWRFGLRMAQQWRQRLGLEENLEWKTVLEKLAPLPVEDGVYVTYEGIPEMWTRYAYEHPALIGTWGMLPGDGVDKEIFGRTLEKVSRTWNFVKGVWGWDFPMLAMAAARSGHPDKAIDFLLHESPNFQFDVHGLATGGPFPYFPSNGALLTAVAMMAEGWDGSQGQFPGFPQDGTWEVKAEGFNRMP